VTISSRPGTSRRRVAVTGSQMAFALGACGGLATIVMPPAGKTAPKLAVNWPARSLIRNLAPVVRGPGSVRK
jgi:hypothetical protein